MVLMVIHSSELGRAGRRQAWPQRYKFYPLNFWGRVQGKTGLVCSSTELLQCHSCCFRLLLFSPAASNGPFKQRYRPKLSFLLALVIDCSKEASTRPALVIQEEQMQQQESCHCFLSWAKIPSVFSLSVSWHILDQTPLNNPVSIGVMKTNNTSTLLDVTKDLFWIKAKALPSFSGHLWCTCVI